MKSNLIDIIVIIVHETEKVWLLGHGFESYTWIPKSRAEIAPNMDGKTHTLTLEQAFAEEKEMV